MRALLSMPRKHALMLLRDAAERDYSPRRYDAIFEKSSGNAKRVQMRGVAAAILLRQRRFAAAIAAATLRCRLSAATLLLSPCRRFRLPIRR